MTQRKGGAVFVHELPDSEADRFVVGIALVGDVGGQKLSMEMANSSAILGWVTKTQAESAAVDLILMFCPGNQIA